MTTMVIDDVSAAGGGGGGTYADSGELSLPFYSSVTWNHAKNKRPAQSGAFIRCKTADGGFPVGAEIPIPGAVEMAGDNKWTLWNELNDMKFAMRGTVLGSSTTGAGSFAATAANWKLVLWGIWT